MKKELRVEVEHTSINNQNYPGVVKRVLIEEVDASESVIGMHYLASQMVRDFIEWERIITVNVYVDGKGFNDYIMGYRQAPDRN